MSHKKTRAGDDRKPSGTTAVKRARVTKNAAPGRPLWLKALRLAFYIIMSALIVVAIVHYTQHYIRLVSRH